MYIKIKLENMIEVFIFSCESGYVMFISSYYILSVLCVIFSLEK